MRHIAIRDFCAPSRGISETVRRFRVFSSFVFENISIPFHTEKVFYLLFVTKPFHRVRLRHMEGTQSADVYNLTQNSQNKGFVPWALINCHTSAHKCKIVRSIIKKGVHLLVKRCTANARKVYTKIQEGVHLFIVYERSWKQTWALAKENMSGRESKYHLYSIIYLPHPLLAGREADSWLVHADFADWTDSFFICAFCVSLTSPNHFLAERDGEGPYMSNCMVNFNPMVW